MSIPSIVGSILGVVLFLAIMFYDIISDGRFADWWAADPPVEEDTDEYGEPCPILITEDFACERYNHAERQGEGLWCPNPDCPDTEHAEITEEIPLVSKRLSWKHGQWKN